MYFRLTKQGEDVRLCSTRGRLEVYSRVKRLSHKHTHVCITYFIYFSTIWLTWVLFFR